MKLAKKTKIDIDVEEKTQSNHTIIATSLNNHISSSPILHNLEASLIPFENLEPVTVWLQHEFPRSVFNKKYGSTEDHDEGWTLITRLKKKNRRFV